MSSRSRSRSKKRRSETTTPKMGSGKYSAEGGATPAVVPDNKEGAGTPPPAAVNVVPDVQAQELIESLVRANWTCADFKRRIDRSIRLGKVTGAYASVFLMKMLAGGLIWYFNDIGKIWVADEANIARAKHLTKNLDMEKAYEIVLEVEKNRTMYVEEFRSYNMSVVNATKLIETYVQTNERTARYLVELIDHYDATNETRPLAEQYAGFLRDLQNNTISDETLLSLVKGQKIAARYVYEGIPEIEGELVKGHKLKILMEKIEEGNKNSQAKMEVLKDAVLRSGEALKLFNSTANRLKVETSLEAFIRNIIDELKLQAEKTESRAFSLTASFLLSHYGLQIIHTVAEGVQPLIEARINQILLDEGVTVHTNETAHEWKNRRSQMTAQVVARLGYFVTGENVIMLAGVAMATNTLYLTLLSSIISVGFAFGENIVRDLKRNFINAIQADVKAKCSYTKSSDLEYREGVDVADRYLDSRTMHLKLFTYAALQRFFKTSRMPLALYCFYPKVVGACVFSLGFAYSYGWSIYNETTLATSATTLLSLSQFDRATVFIPAGLTVAYTIHETLQDIRTVETEEHVDNTIGVVVQALKIAGKKLYENLDYVHWALGAASLALMMADVPTSPQNLISLKIFGNGTFLGIFEKNDLDVFYWKQKNLLGNKSTWGTGRRPPLPDEEKKGRRLLLRLRDK